MVDEPVQTRTRKVMREAIITENRCLWCHEWFEAKRPELARYCPRPKTCRQSAHDAQRALAKADNSRG
jgi:hypothetical protein